MAVVAPGFVLYLPYAVAVLHHVMGFGGSGSGAPGCVGPAGKFVAAVLALLDDFVVVLNLGLGLGFGAGVGLALGLGLAGGFALWSRRAGDQLQALLR